MRSLLSEGAYVDATDDAKRTALMIASAKGHAELVQRVAAHLELGVQPHDHPARPLSRKIGLIRKTRRSLSPAAERFAEVLAAAVSSFTR